MFFPYGLSQDVEYMLYSRILLFIHSIYNSLHLLIPDSQSIPLPTHLFLGNHKCILYGCASVCFVMCSFVSYFRLHIEVVSYDIFFLCMTSLSMITSVFIPVLANAIISFFFVTSILLCLWVCAHTCVHARMCVRVHHIFFIHLFVDGYLGCFHISAILNNASMNLGVCMCLFEL